jgi:hypothetical protein
MTIIPERLRSKRAKKNPVLFTPGGESQHFVNRGSSKIDTESIACHWYKEDLRPAGWIHFLPSRQEKQVFNWGFIPAKLANKFKIKDILKHGRKGVHYALGWDGLHEMVEEYGVLTKTGDFKFRFRVKECDTPDLVIPPVLNGGVAAASAPTVSQSSASEDEDDGTPITELTTAPGDNGSAAAVDPTNAAASVPTVIQPLSSEDEDDGTPAGLPPAAVRMEVDEELFAPVSNADSTSPAGHRAAVPTFIPTSDSKADRILGIIECMSLTAEELRIIQSKTGQWANDLESFHPQHMLLSENGYKSSTNNNRPGKQIVRT